MDEEVFMDWVDANDVSSVEEEDVLDEVELNRLMRMAEHPERCDPVFLFLRGNRQGGGRGR